MANEIERIIIAHDRNQMPLDKAAQKIAKIVFSESTQRIREEARVTNAELASILEYELLEAESQDGRSADKMRQTGLALASGGTTACITAAECDPTVGIGMSHRNTVTEKYHERRYSQFLGMKPARRKAYLRTVFPDNKSPEKVAQETIPLEEIMQVSCQVANEAMNQFEKLPGSKDAGNHQMLVTGINYIKQTDKPTVANAIKEVIYERRDPMKVEINIRLGTLGKGIIYGGPSHKFFSTAQIVGPGDLKALALKAIFVAN